MNSIQDDVIGERVFIATNHWYGPEKSNTDNRTPFVEWVLKLLAESN